MAKLYLSILLPILCFIDIQAQKLNVEGFVTKANDITARTQPRKDINGNDCALVKVQLAQPREALPCVEPLQIRGKYHRLLPWPASCLLSYNLF